MADDKVLNIDTSDIKKQRDIGQIRLDPQSTEAYFEWVIPDFFELPQDPDCVFCSPVFSFHDAEWCLNFCSNGFTETNCVGWIALALGKLHSDTINHRVSFKINFRMRDGTEFGCCSGEETFVGDGSLCRAPFFLKRSRIIRRRSQIAPDGILIFSCTLRAAGGKPEASCQTDVPRRKDECTQTERNLSCEDPTEVPEKIEGDAFTKDASGNPEGLDKLIRDFKDLLVSGEDSDATIKVKNREFKVHRLILSARSPYFAEKFRCNTTEGSTNVVDISECDPDAFREFLLYLYSGQIEKIAMENVLDLYDVGCKFHAQEVRSQCIKFFRKELTVNNFCDIIELAIKHNESELLIKAATDFFVRNIRKIIATAKWKNFHREYPKESHELHVAALEYLNIE